MPAHDLVSRFYSKLVRLKAIDKTADIHIEDVSIPNWFD